MSLRTPKGKAIAVLLGIFGLIIGGAVLARYASAESGPAIAVTARDASSVVTSSSPIGSSISANASVASSTASTTPTGTVNFNLYANTSCAGTPTTQSGVALASGSATSSTTTMGAAGLSYQVHYSGDANNMPSDSACLVVQPTSSQSAINGALSATSVLAGSSIFESATLSGITGNASGTVSYRAYTDSSCTQGARSAGTVSVSSGSVPNSSTLFFTAAGNYYWQALYSGDSQNSAATSSCALLTVAATSTPDSTGNVGTMATSTSNPNRHGDDDGDDDGHESFSMDFHFNFGQLVSAWRHAERTGSSTLTGSSTITIHSNGLHLGELKHKPAKALGHGKGRGDTDNDNQ